MDDIQNHDSRVDGISDGSLSELLNILVIFYISIYIFYSAYIVITTLNSEQVNDENKNEIIFQHRF